MRYWCLVTSKENWKICKTNSVWGMDYRYLPTLKRYVHKGDRAVVYSHGGNFVAEVEIISEAYEEFTHIGWTKNSKPYMFPYRIKIKIIKEGAIHISFSVNEDRERAIHSNPNFIDDVIFISDKGKTWNIYLQVSIVNISEEDFSTISSALKETFSVKTKDPGFLREKSLTRNDISLKGREGGRKAREKLRSRLQEEGAKIKLVDKKFYYLENEKKLLTRFSNDLGKKWWFGIEESECNNVDYILILICVYDNRPYFIILPQEKVKMILKNASKDHRNNSKINIFLQGESFICRELENESFDEYIDNFSITK